MKITPRGILAALFVLVVVVVCVRLGLWQLDRREQRRERNRAVAEARSLPPIEIAAGSLPALAAEPDRYVHRAATVRGRYLPGRSLVLRGRVADGTPGVHLVTPLRLVDGGAVVLVNRGWVPAPDAATIDPKRFEQRGIQEVSGILQRIPRTENRGDPARVGSVLTYRRLDLDALRSGVPGPVLPLYVQRSAGAADPPLPLAVAPASLDEGPHLGYAFQWFAFAAIALVGFGVVVRHNTRPRP